MKNRIDQEGESALLSRREWLKMLALPTAGALVGTALLEREAIAEKPGEDNRQRGARGVYNCRDYGTKGDDKTLDTAAFNAAITACAAAGGGVVLVPPGRYLAGTILLKSNITLLIEAGAEITGTSDLSQYEAFIPPKGNPLAELPPHWHRALVLGIDVENVTITGQGILNGNKAFDPQGEENMRGPHAVLFGNSRNIVLRDISIKDSGNYAVMLEFTSDVEVRGIQITGGWDGVHIRGWKDRPSRNISIIDSQFFTGDDSIAGWFWENTLITRCTINSSCNGIRVIGPAQRLIIHDCLFFGPGRFEHRTSRERHRRNMLTGILLQPGSWNPTQGLLDEVQISDVTMHDVASPFGVTLTPGNRAGRVEINRMTATGIYKAAASIESWAEDPIEKMTLRDVNLEFQGGGSTEQTQVPVQQPVQDARVLPVWGLYARKIKMLELQNVRLNLIEADARPALMADQVERIELDTFKTPRSEVAPLALSDVQELNLRDTELHVVDGSCTGIETSNDPLTITASIKNQSASGLARVQVSLNDRLQTRWINIQANEQKNVVLTGWGELAPGTYIARCGNLQKKLHIAK